MWWEMELGLLLDKVVVLHGLVSIRLVIQSELHEIIDGACESRIVRVHDIYSGLKSGKPIHFMLFWYHAHFNHEAK